MTQSTRLAKSCWPRPGYDQSNQSHIPFPGAGLGKIVREITLPGLSQEGAQDICGSVMSDMMTLRVVNDGILSAISIEWGILWWVELRDAENKPSEYCSLPVALQDGACLIALSDRICIYDAGGHCMFQKEVLLPDDSGCAPNITETGQILHSSINGDIWCIDAVGAREVGSFGYDVLPPAIYPDNSIAVAGYYGEGFCRVGLDGQIIWKTEFKEADMLPTINQDSIAAVGSKNDNTSAFFSPGGKLLGRYDRASVFGEYDSDSWIARSKKNVAKLTVDGKEIWRYALQDEVHWGHCQPIVDSEGRIYLLDDGQLLCLSGEGKMIFSTEVHGNSWGGLSCVSPGKMAYVGAGKLQIIT